MDLEFIKIAHAEGETIATTESALPLEAHASGGISIDPMVIVYNILNVAVFLFILKLILYKPLLALLKEREAHIKKGVEDADNAKILLLESEATREKMLKEARAEGQTMVETARQSGELVRTELVAKAQGEAQQIITSGQLLIEAERSKALQEVKAHVVEVILKASEKILKQKIDPAQDARLIKDSIESYVN